MYAGHFSLGLVFRRWFPNASPYVLCIGVGFLDIVFGLLAFWDMEGFALREDKGGPLGNVALRCDYSHSLVGAILLSAFYGAVTQSFVSGFVASFSHFVTDWLVHASDLFLDPVSKVLVGGTGLWDSYPTAAFYLEAALCVFAGIHGGAIAKHDIWALGTSASILVTHFSSIIMVPQLYAYILAQDDPYRRLLTGVLVPILFTLPGLLMGYALTRSEQATAAAKSDKSS